MGDVVKMPDPAERTARQQRIAEQIEAFLALHEAHHVQGFQSNLCSRESRVRLRRSQPCRDMLIGLEIDRILTRAIEEMS